MATQMRQYWAFIRTTPGGVIKVYVTADTWFNAQQMLKNQYGSNLISDAAPVA
jgi:hypothetical protein